MKFSGIRVSYRVANNPWLLQHAMHCAVGLVALGLVLFHAIRG